MTVYVFNRDKTVRQPLAMGQVTRLIHGEAANDLTASIDANVSLENGEHLGVKCADGRFRLFTIENVARDDDKNVNDVTATDAIVADLQEIILEEEQQLDVKLMDGIKALLPKGWTVTGTQPDRLEKSRAYYTSAWQMLKTFEQLYEWRIVTYYRFDGSAISDRVVETMQDEAVYRGRILQSRKDASKVYITKKGKPITRLYGLGPAQGTRDVQTNLTFADAEWSKYAGDPVDKPKGQKWVQDQEAVAKYGLHTATITINDAENEKELLEKTWKELQRLKEPAVTAEATVTDVEALPGHEHQIIRLGDLVAIRLKNGQYAAARVIDVKRDLLHQHLTKIIVGNKKDAISYQVSTLIASATHTFERLTIYQNRFYEDEALIQLNAEFIQINAKKIEENAEQIRLNAGFTDEVNNRITAAEQRLDGISATIDLWAGTLDEFGNRLDGAEVMIDGLDRKITATVEDMEGTIATLELKVDEQGSLISAVADRVNVQAGAIETQADLISQKADRIELVGFVTIDEFAALEGRISDLEGGLANITVLNADTANITDLNAIFGSFASMEFADSIVSKRKITMGSISTVGSALSSDGTLDLSHSHKVTVSDDGTITLGEVATTGDSFKIADTRTYKEGVSAAIKEGENSVTLSFMGWQNGVATVKASNGNEEEVELPEFSVSGGETFSGNKTTVYFSTASVSGPLARKEVDASGVYENGYAAAAPASVSRVATYDTDGNVYNVTVVVKAADGTTRSFDLVAINASAAYEAGYAAGQDAASGYDEGYAAGYEAAKGKVELSGQITSISNTAPNYMFAQGSAFAMIDGEQVAATSFNKAQYFPGLGQ